MNLDAMTPTRVGWCLTTGAYPGERCERDHRPHDHHDIVIDYSPETGQGRPIYRLDPVGTVYRLADGTMLRLRRYEDDVFRADEIEDRIFPTYDWWGPTGGASSGYDERALTAIWDGVNLCPGVTRVVPVAPERAAAQSTYIRPNGEVWRLRDWRKRLSDLDGPLVASYVVMLPSGSVSSGDTLPDDARLVWAP